MTRYTFHNPQGPHIVPSQIQIPTLEAAWTRATDDVRR